MSTSTIPRAERMLDTLCAHEAELRAAGIRRLSLFGSVARGDAAADSDVDLAAELDPDAHIGLFQLHTLEQRLCDILGTSVDLVTEPHDGRFTANMDRDRRRVF